MTDKMTFSNDVNNLRRLAEKKAARITEKLEILSPEEIQQMLHELHVHQVELEMQNEELRVAHAELDAVRARYFDLYDLAPVGYCTIGKDGLILEANLTAATLMGVDRRTLVKQPISRFILKEDQDIYYLHHKSLFDTDSASSGQSGQPQAFELRMVKKDETPFWVRLEAVAAIDSDGAPMCRVLISDITDNKRVEVEKAKIEAQKHQLQKAESLGRMAGAIAHHFNNQLQVVMGNLELAILKLSPDSDTVKDLTEAMKASRQASEISSLMLTYLGQTPGKHEPIDLSEACRRSLTLLQAAAPKGTLLKGDFPASGPVIRANAGQIHHVLTNLVTNAWESADKNRRGIGLTVKTVSQANMLASKRFPIDWLPRDPAYACLEVSDAGCGIAENDFEKIFDPFFSTKFTGRGLGLSVVLGIVRAPHGAVMLESEPDRGSTFRVFFPLSDEEAPNHSDKAAQILEVKGGGTVLVVEDGEMVRKMVVTMLTRLGFRVLEAKNGVEAVEIFRHHQEEIRCVLSDLTMPQMDGWETLMALRKLSPGIPVILSSGYDEAHVMAGEHPERPNAFLGKPYHLKELGETINRVL
ncbi:MAG: ATP-binding protein [Desulfatirhabdiaceae bacterium]